MIGSQEITVYRCPECGDHEGQIDGGCRHGCGINTVETQYVPMAELDRLRDALRRIANAESGPWGWIAFDALHPERAEGA